MAQIQPAHPEPSTPASERKVYERLRDGLPAEWLVLHSRRLVAAATDRHPRADPAGQLDFLVFNPSWGMIGLEVKGGRIARGPTGWASMDRNGGVHSIAGPGKRSARRPPPDGVPARSSKVTRSRKTALLWLGGRLPGTSRPPATSVWTSRDRSSSTRPTCVPPRTRSIALAASSRRMEPRSPVRRERLSLAC